jgi:hypothetical protein
MDYAVDILNRNVEINIGPQFIYDDRRFFSKIYVLLKSIGLVVYTTTLTMCAVPELYILMIGAMFLSTANSTRYEYAHYRRYGTIFSSIDEYNQWKQQQWPKSRLIFSIVELAIKIGYFIKAFPPQFDFITMCDVGKSVLNIHMLLLFSIYIIIIVSSVCLVSSFYFCNQYRYVLPSNNSTAAAEAAIVQREIVSLPAQLPVIMNVSPNDECCICMDVDNIQAWLILPCGHKFHALCISRWLFQHQTCPVCRLDIRSILV